MNLVEKARAEAPPNVPANDPKLTAEERPSSADDRRPKTGAALHSNDQGPTTINRPDELFMDAALRAAQRALEAGEVPVGAVVVCNGEVIAEGWNQNLSGNDPTAHAEVVALRAAGAIVGNHRLGECELFATIEPCSMCAGALIHARIKSLVYGADDPKTCAFPSVLQVVNHPQLNHRMEVRGGVLAGRCAEMLQAFFRQRREG